MNNKEIKTQLIHKRMEAKAKIEKLRFLSEATKMNFDNEINRLLDLINTIDKALKELD